MATVDPRYFDWGARFQEGMEQSRQRRLQDIALGQQQEDRARDEEERQLRMSGLKQQQAAQQSESQYANHLREATTLLNAAKALKGVPLERRRQALEQWGQRNQIIAGALKHIPPETDLSDQGLDEFAASMGIAVQGYGQPQGNSDFLRAIEIMRNPQASPQERQAAEVALGLKARAVEMRPSPRIVQGVDPNTGQPAFEVVDPNSGQRPTILPAPKKAPESTFDKEIAKQTAKRIAEVQETLPVVDERIQAMKTVLAGFERGQYSTGMENAFIPDYLQSTNNQELMTKINQEVLGKAEQMKGALSDKDVAFLKSATLDLNKGEAANKKILADVIAVLERAAARSGQELEHYQAGGSIKDYKGAAQKSAPQPGPSVSNW